MKKHLLVTNDFPPKRGGIQNYLFELWSRLDPKSFAVLTTKYAGSDEFDAKLAFPVRRVRGPMLPTPALRRLISSEIASHGADFVVLDPTLPLAALAPGLGVPYVILAHGAELLVPMKLPGTSALCRRILGGAEKVICSGSDIAYEIVQFLRRPHDASSQVHVITPGVDLEYFSVPTGPERDALRSKLGYDPNEEVVLFVSRLVPRKGADVVIRALGVLGATHRSLRFVIVGSGRDSARLQRLAKVHGVRCDFVGSVRKSELREYYQACDLFAMLCRDRWFKMEREGFGIVFLEAQACGRPVIVGRSGGSVDALGQDTGYLVQRPNHVPSVTKALREGLDRDGLLAQAPMAPRRFVEEGFDYGSLARDLQALLDQLRPMGRDAL